MPCKTSNLLYSHQSAYLSYLCYHSWHRDHTDEEQTNRTKQRRELAGQFQWPKPGAMTKTEAESTERGSKDYERSSIEAKASRGPQDRQISL